MKSCLLAVTLSLVPATAFAQFPSGGFLPYPISAQDAAAAGAIATANQAVQQCMQKMRGRSVDTVCTTPTPESGKSK
jgi:hypothetical protein